MFVEHFLNSKLLSSIPLTVAHLTLLISIGLGYNVGAPLACLTPNSPLQRAVPKHQVLT